MKRKTKIIVLWLLTICGFASHSITDMLPMFWGKNIAIATDGVVPGGMVAFMMLLSFFLPACAILCLLADGKGKALKWVNAVLAGFMALFNIAHAFMELPSDNVGQYLVLPMMVVIGLYLAYLSFKFVRQDEQ
jgi:hypothetical protein